uniref:Uncharacterized protein n=1 Tax=Oryza sativa subsp. japonica TaxID=39947 RepID=Q2R1B8_ORYSJ|nr:hypothetical protein LOC_Os11g39699 [Oryza sativa Japonica Group]
MATGRRGARDDGNTTDAARGVGINNIIFS